MKPLFLFFFFYAFSIFFFLFVSPRSTERLHEEGLCGCTVYKFYRGFVRNFSHLPWLHTDIRRGGGREVILRENKKSKEAFHFALPSPTEILIFDHELKKNINNNKICYVFLEDFIKSINCWTLRSGEIRTIRKVQWVKLIRNM